MPKKKFIINKLFILICFLLSITFSVKAPPLDIKALLGGDSTDSLFTSGIGAKQKRLEKLNKYLSEFTKQSKSSNQNISAQITQINQEINELEEQVKNEDENEIDLINTKLGILKDRRQNLQNLQELWKTTELLMRKNIKLVQKFIEQYQDKTETSPMIKYSWENFIQLQEEILDLESKIKLENTKKISLIKKIESEKGNLNYYKNQIGEFQKEISELKNNPQNLPLEELRLKDEIFNQEIIFNKEKINYSQLNIEKLNLEIRYKENELEQKEYNLNLLNKKFKTFENRLFNSPQYIITVQDEEKIKNDLEQARTKAFNQQEKLSKQKDIKKKERQKYTNQIEALQKKLKTAKVENNELQIALLESQIEKQQAKISIFSKEVSLINLQVESAKMSVTEKELEHKILDLYKNIGSENINLDEFISTFKKQNELLLNSIKILKNEKREQESSTAEINRKLEALQKYNNKIEEQKNTLFKSNVQTYNNILDNTIQTEKYYQQEQQIIQKNITLNTELAAKQERTIKRINFTILSLESKQISLNIWRRSPKAISLRDLTKSLSEAEIFFSNLFWATPKYFAPTIILNKLNRFDFYAYLSLILLLIFFIISFFVIKVLLNLINKKIKYAISQYQGNKNILYVLLTTESLVTFSVDNFKLLFTWFFVYLHIIFGFNHIFSLMQILASKYSVAIFYLFSIPILIFLSKNLISSLKALNQKLSFLFFTEQTQSRFLFLITSILYSTVSLLPLRKAFIVYTNKASNFADVILAGYSLILVISILLFFSKEDVLTLLPSKNKCFIWLKEEINKYYYPVFIFFMGLLILSNPYVGYYNLAWYLAFSVPSTIFLIMGMFFIHAYIRKYSITFFLKEEDGDIIDNFDYAKTYYGFFIFATFLILLFFNFILISRIWKFNYTPTILYQLLSEEWVLTPGEGVKLGIIQFLYFISFIVSGFLISSILQKFVLNKLFDIFRTESGAQNTIFRISHYSIVSISILLGFATIHLEQFIFWIGGFLVVGLGIALRDVVLDYIAGFFVLIERPIEIGNYIEIDQNTKGTVHKISARATTIRTARNFHVIVPNKDLITKQITNWAHGRIAVGFEVSLLVSYDSDPKIVKELLLNVISNHPQILKVPATIVRLEDFCDNGMQFFARAFVSTRRLRDQWDIKSQIRFKIIEEFQKNNIVIPFPQQVVHFYKHDKKENNIKNIDIKFDRE